MKLFVIFLLFNNILECKISLSDILIPGTIGYFLSIYNKKDNKVNGVIFKENEYIKKIYYLMIFGIYLCMRERNFTEEEEEKKKNNKKSLNKRLDEIDQKIDDFNVIDKIKSEMEKFSEDIKKKNEDEIINLRVKIKNDIELFRKKEEDFILVKNEEIYKKFLEFEKNLKNEIDKKIIEFKAIFNSFNELKKSFLDKVEKEDFQSFNKLSSNFEKLEKSIKANYEELERKYNENLDTKNYSNNINKLDELNKKFEDLEIKITEENKKILADIGNINNLKENKILDTINSRNKKMDEKFLEFKKDINQFGKNINDKFDLKMDSFNKKFQDLKKDIKINYENIFNKNKEEYLEIINKLNSFNILNENVQELEKKIKEENKKVEDFYESKTEEIIKFIENNNKDIFEKVFKIKESIDIKMNLFDKKFIEFEGMRESIENNYKEIKNNYEKEIKEISDIKKKLDLDKQAYSNELNKNIEEVKSKIEEENNKIINFIEKNENEKDIKFNKLGENIKNDIDTKVKFLKERFDESEENKEIYFNNFKNNYDSILDKNKKEYSEIESKLNSLDQLNKKFKDLEIKMIEENERILADIKNIDNLKENKILSIIKNRDKEMDEKFLEFGKNINDKFDLKMDSFNEKFQDLKKDIKINYENIFNKNSDKLNENFQKLEEKIKEENKKVEGFYKRKTEEIIKFIENNNKDIFKKVSKIEDNIDIKINLFNKKFTEFEGIKESIENNNGEIKNNYKEIKNNYKEIKNNYEKEIKEISDIKKKLDLDKQTYSNELNKNIEEVKSKIEEENNKIINFIEKNENEKDIKFNKLEENIKNKIDIKVISLEKRFDESEKNKKIYFDAIKDSYNLIIDENKKEYLEIKNRLNSLDKLNEKFEKLEDKIENENIKIINSFKDGNEKIRKYFLKIDLKINDFIESFKKIEDIENKQIEFFEIVENINRISNDNFKKNEIELNNLSESIQELKSGFKINFEKLDKDNLKNEKYLLYLNNKLDENNKFIFDKIKEYQLNLDNSLKKKLNSIYLLNKEENDRIIVLFQEKFNIIEYMIKNFSDKKSEVDYIKKSIEEIKNDLSKINKDNKSYNNDLNYKLSRVEEFLKNQVDKRNLENEKEYLDKCKKISEEINNFEKTLLVNNNFNNNKETLSLIKNKLKKLSDKYKYKNNNNYIGILEGKIINLEKKILINEKIEIFEINQNDNRLLDMNNQLNKKSSL